MPNPLSPEERATLISEYERGVALLRGAWENVPEDGEKWRPAPDKWSAHEVVIHCADSETYAATRVRLLLAGKSDVRLAQLAGRRLFETFMRAGVEIYEYQPQILHGKLVLIDDIVYAGSCNLDLRSLNFNYELMLRVQDPTLAAEAREIFEKDLTHSRRINPATWRGERGLWTKWREDLAHFVLTRLDPFVARWQLRMLR